MEQHGIDDLTRVQIDPGEQDAQQEGQEELPGVLMGQAEDQGGTQHRRGLAEAADPIQNQFAEDQLLKDRGDHNRQDPHWHRVPAEVHGLNGNDEGREIADQNADAPEPEGCQGTAQESRGGKGLLFRRLGGKPAANGFGNQHAQQQAAHIGKEIGDQQRPNQGVVFQQIGNLEAAERAAGQKEHRADRPDQGKHRCGNLRGHGVGDQGAQGGQAIGPGHGIVGLVWPRRVLPSPNRDILIRTNGTSIRHWGVSHGGLRLSVGRCGVSGGGLRLSVGRRGVSGGGLRLSVGRCGVSGGGLRLFKRRLSIADRRLRLFKRRLGIADRRLRLFERRRGSTRRRFGTHLRFAETGSAIGAEASHSGQTAAAVGAELDLHGSCSSFHPGNFARIFCICRQYSTSIPKKQQASA